jgi:hypothetical protein
LVFLHEFSELLVKYWCMISRHIFKLPMRWSNLVLRSFFEIALSFWRLYINSSFIVFDTSLSASLAGLIAWGPIKS